MKNTSMQKLLFPMTIRALSIYRFIGPVFLRIQIQIGNCTNIHDLCFDEFRAKQNLRLVFVY